MPAGTLLNQNLGLHLKTALLNGYPLLLAGYRFPQKAPVFHTGHGGSPPLGLQCSKNLRKQLLLLECEYVGRRDAVTRKSYPYIHIQEIGLGKPCSPLGETYIAIWTQAD